MSIENIENRSKIPGLKTMPVCKNCKDVSKLRKSEAHICTRENIFAYVGSDESCDYHTYAEKSENVLKTSGE